MRKAKVGALICLKTTKKEQLILNSTAMILIEANACMPLKGTVGPI